MGDNVEIILPQVIIITVPLRLPICDYCSEPIFPDEPLGPFLNSMTHVECAFRMIMGSVGHQQRQCSCYGQIDTSEEGLTVREGARRSLELFRRR